MLNELLLLERGLARAGVQLTPKHPDVKAPGKFMTVHVRLDAAGGIAGLALFSPEETGRLWTLRDGQHNSFPFSKTGKPLRPDAAAEVAGGNKKAAKKGQGETIAERRARLLALAEQCECDDAVIFPSEGFRRRLQERRLQFAALAGGEEGAVPAVIDRFLLATGPDRDFLKQLLDRLVIQVTQSGEVWLDALEAVLTEASGVNLFMDVETGEFAEDVCSARQPFIVSAVLMAEEEDVPERCALTGDEVVMLSGNFPQPNLPYLGQSFLYAKNTDIPAAKRYGVGDSAGFRIGQVLAGQLAGAIEFVTQEESKGKTWAPVAGEAPKSTDVLVCYVAGEEKAAALIQAFVAEEGEASVEQIYDFCSYCVAGVVAALKGRHGDGGRDAFLDVALFRAVDKANRKIVYHRRLTVGALQRAAFDWDRGVRNVPGWLRLGVKGGMMSPPYVAPARLAYLTREKFIREGEGRAAVTGIATSTALDFFLAEHYDERALRVILRTLLDRFRALLYGVAVRRHRWTGADEGKEQGWLDHERALQAVTLFGVVLHKLGRSPGQAREIDGQDEEEGYMKETGFRLGQMLAALDVVHVAYCMDVRKGDIPPALLGAGVMSVFERSPVQGLKVLFQRMKPYMAWAVRTLEFRKAKPDTLEISLDENIPSKEELKKLPAFQRAAFLREQAIRRGLSQYRFVRKNAAALHGQNLNEIADQNIFCAGLLLGYLAGPPPFEAQEVSKEESVSVAASV